MDRLKIDSHFIRDIVEDEINSTMVMSINVVGHAMELLTVAEGVEDKSILDSLKKIGIDYAQGYTRSVDRNLLPVSNVICQDRLRRVISSFPVGRPVHQNSFFGLMPEPRS